MGLAKMLVIILIAKIILKTFKKAKNVYNFKKVI